MPHHIDAGVRCERHVGEAFPPRCYDCTALAADTLPLPTDPPPVGVYSSTECEIHAGYFLPCEKCFRVELEPSRGSA